MAVQLPSQSNTFTLELVKGFLDNELQSKTKDYKGEFIALELSSERKGGSEEEGGRTIAHDSVSRANRVRNLCLDIVRKPQTSKGATEALDQCLSEWLTCNFKDDDVDNVTADNAVDMLKRLPPHPVPLPFALLEDLCQEVQRKPFTPDTDTISHWEALDVARYLDKNTIRIALEIAILKPAMHDLDRSQSLRQFTIFYVFLV